MKIKRFGNDAVIRLDRGEEVVGKLLEAAELMNIRLGSFTGLGAVEYAKVGVYNVAERKYYANEFTGEMEITALVGNFTTMNGERYVHPHITLGRADGSCVGGHLNEARISATAEIFVRVLDGEIGRFKDEEVTGLNLLEM